MAESVVFTLASKVLSTIASPAFKMAYEKGVSIWEAREELDKLKVSMETIHAVLLDAEKKQEDSLVVKNWIKRLKDVFYDAEDLFDEFATEDLIKQQMMEGKSKLSLKNKVRVSFSKLNPIVSRNSIAKKVKAIRERLAEVSIDLTQFVRCSVEKPMYNMGRGEDRGCFVDAKSVIGRDEDKKIMLEMLFNESDSDRLDNPVVLAIVGIGGMGKTTLAQLIFNDEKITKTFKNRWFACMSDTIDEREVLGKIFQSIRGVSYNDLSVGHLQTEIRESIKDQNCLLVLDDVWEEDRARWQHRLRLMSSLARESRIIVTTRLPSVAEAVGALKPHNLEGLSKDDAWSLFKNLAFAKEFEKDPRRESLGKQILKKCSGVPLAIQSIGSLLYLNNKMEQWEAIERDDLPMLGRKHNDQTMRVLKLSYDHLPSNLKQCFTYCCLFPKDYRYDKLELIYHWIAQGYINFDEEKFSFMHLLRMGFFQEVEVDKLGEIQSCKMHDIMHDLALHMIGEEGEFGKSLNVNSSARHVRLIVDSGESGSWDIPSLLLNVKSIRSCMLSSISNLHSQPNLDQLFSNFEFLRTLTLSSLSIKHIPPSIGKLKLVRYLDLSLNNFEELPDSITSLANLLVLNLDGCWKLKVWPRSFKNLIKLRCLKFNMESPSMPEGIVGMDNLQYLSCFNVHNWSEINRLNKVLERVRGSLLIKFDRKMKVENEGWWQIPTTKSLQDLEISSYPGYEIRGWGYSESEIKLERLRLESCENVTYLSPIICLKYLKLCDLPELEFIEEVEEVNTHNSATSQKFFPFMKKLSMKDLPKLKGWQRKVAAEAASTSSKSGFPGEALACLEELKIERCSSLTSLHLASPRLRKIYIDKCNELLSIDLDKILSLRSLIIKDCKQLMSLHIEAIPGEALASLEELEIKRCSNLKSVHLTSLRIQKIDIDQCNVINSIELDQILSLRSLRINKCKELVSLHIDAHPFVGLEEIVIKSCPEFTLRLLNIQGKKLSMQSLKNISIGDLWEESSRFVGLQSLHIPSPHLRKVHLVNCAGLTSLEVEAATDISITRCSELKNFRIAQPIAVQTLSITSSSLVDWGSISNLLECSCVSKIRFSGVDGGFIERFLSLSSPSLKEGFKSTGSLTVALTSLEEFSIHDVHGLKTLIIKSPRLIKISIFDCNQLTSVELESPMAHPDGCVTIGCSQLKNVRIPSPIALKRLEIVKCTELSLNTGVDWDSLPDLKYLELEPLPRPEEIPQRLRQRQDLGNLAILDVSPLSLLSFQLLYIHPQFNINQSPNSSPSGQWCSNATTTRGIDELFKTQIEINNTLVATICSFLGAASFSTMIIMII